MSKRKCFIFFLVISLSSTVTFAQQPKLILPEGHTDEVLYIRYSPDGKKIVTASRDHTAKIWEVSSGRLLCNLDGHLIDVVSAEFSPETKYIVTASRDHSAKIWDARTGVFLINLLGHRGSILSAQFSPDGNNIITASEDSTSKIWVSATGKLRFTLKGHLDRLTSAVYSHEGKRIVTASEDGTAIIWNALTGEEIYSLEGHTDEVVSASFSRDDKSVITASGDHTAKIWNAASGKLTTTLTGHSGELTTAIFSPDNSKCLTASFDQSVIIWDVLTGKKIDTLSGHTDEIRSIVYSPEKNIIATSSWDNTLKLWDANSYKEIATLKGHTNAIESCSFSPDGKRIATASWDNSAIIWDMSTKRPLKHLRGATGQITSAKFFENGESFITASMDGIARIWDTRTASIRHSLKGHRGWLNSVDVSRDENFILTASSDNLAKLWDTKTGKLLRTLKGHEWWVESAVFSKDGNYFATTSQDNTIRIWDAITRKTIKIIKCSSGVICACFSPTGDQLVTGLEDSNAIIWDPVTGKELAILKGHNGRIKSVSYSNSGNEIITTSSNGQASIWEASTGNLTSVLPGHSSLLEFAQFSHNDKKIITAFENKILIWMEDEIGPKIITLEKNSLLKDIDNTNKVFLCADNSEIKILDSTGRLIYNNYGVEIEGESNYIAQIPTDYYKCSPDASKLLYYVTKDLKIITFEQLDVKYNRPDKVLEAIGNTDTALINSYRKAWEKRIKKLGIDTTAFRDGYSVPEADFANRDAIEYEQKNGMLTLHIKAMDSAYKLDRFNVWVNEAPLFGQRGVSIKRKNFNSVDTTLTIKLSQGENRIETSITNVNGTESYRMPLLVNYTPAVKQKESTRFIGIGIDQFTDNKYNLQYSAKDIRDMANSLKRKYKEDIIIDTLFNEQVTVSNVKALKKKLKQTTENDKVIIAYSGHGMLSKEYDYYLSTYAVNFSKPEENGLPYDELENLLDSIPARKKLMLIDACHSGEVDKDELFAMNKTADSLGLKTRGVIVVGEQQQRVGLKNSFELMQSLFVNVGKSTGATIISAAAGNQYALEGVNNLPNGIFTYSILEAMQKYPSMKISELKKIVGERVEQLTKGLQKPTSRNEAIAVDWSLW